MSDVQFKVLDNGPLRVTGTVELFDAERNKYPQKAAFSLCRCGLSSKLPYCDGTHKGKFEPVVRSPKESE